MRKLSLCKEALSELASDELRGVAGGTHVTCNATEACTHVGACVSGNLQCYTVHPQTCFGLTTPAGCLTNNCA